jgi:hypothetical protein
VTLGLGLPCLSLERRALANHVVLTPAVEAKALVSASLPFLLRDRSVIGLGVRLGVGFRLVWSRGHGG